MSDSCTGGQRFQRAPTCLGRALAFSAASRLVPFSPSYWKATAIVVLASSASTQLPAGADPPDSESDPMVPQVSGGGEPPPVEMFHTFWPSPVVKQVMAGSGIRQSPLITPSRFVNLGTANFNAERYRNKIWTPDRTVGVPLDFGTEERYGIPPGYAGWVVLDYEEWDLVEHFDDFVALITETRILRPDVKICQYWRPQINGDEAYRESETAILGLVDAIAPPLYLVNNLENLQRQLSSRATRVRYCLELGRQLDIKVFPMMWKRYPAGVDTDGTRVQLLLPNDLQEQIVEIALLWHDGRRADGLFLFGTDNVVLYNPDRNRSHPDTQDQSVVDATDLQWLWTISALSNGPPVPSIGGWKGPGGVRGWKGPDGVDALLFD